MSGKVKAAFFLRHRYFQEGNDTDSLISEARSLAEQWIDTRWKGEPFLGASTPLPVPSKSLAGNLKEFWNIIILAAKRSAAGGDQQLEIIDLIQEKVHETGTLKRAISPEGKIVHGPRTDQDRVEIAETADGIVWSELPYLRHELFEAFLRPPFLTPAEQWTNLNELCARLTASGLRDLSFYAIWAMFDALEVRQALHRATTGRTDLSIMDWLPAALVWLNHCALQMLKSCQAGAVPPDQTHNDFDCKWYQDGPEYVGYLAREAGIDRAGFSMER